MILKSRSKLILFVLISAAIIFLPLLVYAQTPIDCGATLSGSITTAGQRNSYTFSASANDGVSIRVRKTSGSFTAYMVELYEWKRKALVSDDEIRSQFGEDIRADDLERRRQELSAEKSKLPKFQAKCLGLMLDDPNIPNEIITIDGAGNKGLDLVGISVGSMPP